MILMTQGQLRDGRALLRWTAQELADRTGLRRETIHKLENSADGFENSKLSTLKKIQAALESGGIEFLEDGSVRRRK